MATRRKAKYGYTKHYVLSKSFKEWLKKTYGGEVIYGDVREYATTLGENLTAARKTEIRRYVREEIYGH